MTGIGTIKVLNCCALKYFLQLYDRKNGVQVITLCFSHFSSPFSASLFFLLVSLSLSFTSPSYRLNFLAFTSYSFLHHVFAFLLDSSFLISLLLLSSSTYSYLLNFSVFAVYSLQFLQFSFFLVPVTYSPNCCHPLLSNIFCFPHFTFFHISQMKAKTNY